MTFPESRKSREERKRKRRRGESRVREGKGGVERRSIKI